MDKSRSDTSLAASNNSPITNAFNKRRRVDTNEENIAVTTPTLQLNDGPLESESTITVLDNPNYNPRNTETLAKKLDRLYDKKARFESHENYLSKCLTNNLIPNGLRVFVEPSIGNRDDAFLKKWYERLDEFSRTLTNEVVEFCEQEITKTKLEIEGTSQRLKNNLTEPEFNKVKETITVNQSIRERELQQRKNKKFYGLKYKNNPRTFTTNNYREPSNYQEFAGTSRQERTTFQEQPGHWNRNDNERHQEFAGTSRQDRPPSRKNRNEYEGNQELADASSHNRQPFREQPGYRNRNENEGNQNSYANTVRYGRRQESKLPHELPSGQQSRDTSLSRKRSSHHNITQATNNKQHNKAEPNQEEIPLHEKISLHRRNSERNMNHNNKTNTESARDSEIENLRKRLNELETNNHSTKTGGTQNTTHETADNQKNASAAQNTNRGENSDLKEMKSYLITVLETIKDFDKRLTAQLSTDSTHLER